MREVRYKVEYRTSSMTKDFWAHQSDFKTKAGAIGCAIEGNAQDNGAIYRAVEVNILKTEIVLSLTT